MKPETRARTSTDSNAVKRPVYSSHSVMVFCSGRATVTGGGGGAAPATGLRSQPASSWGVSRMEHRAIARIMAFSSTSAPIGAAGRAFDKDRGLTPDVVQLHIDRYS